MLKGWEFRKTNEPLELVEKEIPAAKKGYAVIKVDACGLCHTDVTTLEDPGWMDILGKVPVILGHEIAGTIIEIGEGVDNVAVGDRVAVCPMPGFDGTGAANGRDGGYATHTTAPHDMLIKVPEGVDMKQAAASTDAGMTPYHAVVDRGGVAKGTKVGMIGIGGLGRLGVNIAVELVAEGYVASRKESARQNALDLGVKEATENILEFKDRGLEVVIDFAGAGQTTEDALEVVAPGGKVVVVGMSSLVTKVNTGTLIMKEADILGSVGGTKEDIEAVLQMMKEGRLRIDVEETTLDKVPEGLHRLHAGEVEGRLIMVNRDDN